MRAPFEYATPTGVKVRCVVCGRVGWGPVTGNPPSPWQKDCLVGHPHKCAICGRVFVNRSALSAHMIPRRKAAA